MREQEFLDAPRLGNPAICDPASWTSEPACAFTRHDHLLPSRTGGTPVRQSDPRDPGLSRYHDTKK